MPELAALVGKAAEVAEITRQGIDGHIVWERGFAMRAKLLAGLRQSEVLRAARNLRPIPGAISFVRRLKEAGAKVALITGGPREVAESAMAMFDADAVYANEFIYEDGVFTGEVLLRVNPQRKGEIVRQLAAKWNAARHEIVALGDGRMDVPLFSEADIRFGINSNGKLRDHVHLETTDYGEAERWLESIGYLTPKSVPESAG